MKALVFILLLFVGLTVFGQNSFKDYFKFSDSDSVHIKPFDFLNDSPQKIGLGQNFKGRKIPKIHPQLSVIDSLFNPHKYFANNYYLIDSSHYAAELVVESIYLEESIVMLLILDLEVNITQFFEAAFWTHMDGTMEETKNTWLLDDDNDGDLDIIMLTDLIDYELHLEDAPNISGTTAVVYRNHISYFEIENITENLWYKLGVQK